MEDDTIYKKPEFKVENDRNELGKNPFDQKDKKTNDKENESFLKRHLHAVVVIIAIILTLVILFIIDRNLRTVSLTIPTDGISITYETDNLGEKVPTDLPIRILSYNADVGSPNELLYYVDTKATAFPDDETFKAKWQIPDSARYRSTYTEICLQDDGEENKNVNGHCVGVNGNDTANYDSAYDIKPDNYNKVSCTYYVSAHSVGLLATVSGWNNLDDDQYVGCAGSANNDDNKGHWSDKSLISSAYNFFNLGSSDGLVPNTGSSSNKSGLTMQNLFQALINGNGGEGNINAGDIINNSFSDNFNYSEYSQQIDLSKTGVIPGESCTTTFSVTHDKTVVTNGSDNKTIQTYSCVPVFNVDEYGRIISVSTRWISYDDTVGNEVVGVTGSYSGLKRSGSGTYLDPYTLAIALNSNVGGLKIDSNGQLAVAAPSCTAKQRPQIIDPTDRNQKPSNGVDKTLNKLQWSVVNGNENGSFICVHDQDNQQLDMAHDPDSTIGNSLVETYTVSLTGDHASSFQFIDRDTTYTGGDGITINTVDGANDIYVDTGRGTILLCSDGSLDNCEPGDKNLQVDIGGNDNDGDGSGLHWDDNHLKINAPTCMTGSNGDGADPAGRLTWSGTDFDCQRISDQINQIFGNNNQSGNVIATIPVVTVNEYGELTFSTQTVSLIGGAGIDFSNGVISMPGIVDGTAKCTSAGQGLSWSGSTFNCTSPYTFQLAASGTSGSSTVYAGNTINFAAGEGTSVSRSGNSIVYSMELGSGSGLEVNPGSGGITLQSCIATGQVLKYNASSGSWNCAADKDTIPDIPKYRKFDWSNVTGGGGCGQSIPNGGVVGPCRVSYSDVGYTPVGAIVMDRNDIGNSAHITCSFNSSQAITSTSAYVTCVSWYDGGGSINPSAMTIVLFPS